MDYFLERGKACSEAMISQLHGISPRCSSPFRPLFTSLRKIPDLYGFSENCLCVGSHLGKWENCILLPVLVAK